MMPQTEFILLVLLLLLALAWLTWEARDNHLDGNEVGEIVPNPPPVISKHEQHELIS
jgi:hypothetical protein